jgi:glycerol-3-phosphate dehydrogenase
LGKRLAHGYPFLEAEVAYCARYEYCESAVDFVARRCRLAFLDTDAAGRALPRIIEILASEHKWDKARKKVELQKGREFLETFKSSKNAQFRDGKHNGKKRFINVLLFSASNLCFNLIASCAGP